MNEKNLTPFSERSVSEAREAGSKGGKASGETRRRKKDMKQKMKALLELPAAANDREQLEALGISPDDMDNEMVLVMAMFLGAAGGDVKAFDRVMPFSCCSSIRTECRYCSTAPALHPGQLLHAMPAFWQ